MIFDYVKTKKNIVNMIHELISFIDKGELSVNENFEIKRTISGIRTGSIIKRPQGSSKNLIISHIVELDKAERELKRMLDFVCRLSISEKQLFYLHYIKGITLNDIEKKGFVCRIPKAKRMNVKLINKLISFYPEKWIIVKFDYRYIYRYVNMPCRFTFVKKDFRKED